MLFCIKTLNDNGTGYTYPNKELLMEPYIDSTRSLY